MGVPGDIKGLHVGSSAIYICIYTYSVGLMTANKKDGSMFKVL